jgi:hypothetical protein
VPTSLPPTHDPHRSSPREIRREVRELGADAWAGLGVVLAMLAVGVIYWSTHTNHANAAGPPPAHSAASSAGSDEGKHL